MSDSKKSIRWGYLPDEIYTHIFTYLPIKSIIICTSVSKTWKSLIQNPTFISTHLHHSHNKNKNKNKNLLLLSVSPNDKQGYILHKEDDPDFIEYTSFDSPFHDPQHPHHRTYNAHGTCNGLICYSFRNSTEEVFLWNPCVRKFLQLPYPNVTVDTHGASCTSLGFGFDPKTNDYKVVRILSMLGSQLDFVKSRPVVSISGRPFDIVDSRPVVEVYSLSTGEWRMLSASASLPPICAISRRGPPAFANGALHWIARTNDKKTFALVFDLGDEVFREILLPELPGLMMCSLCVYGNSIAGILMMVGIDQILKMNIWVMKEYGVASSWTLFFTADFGSGVEALLRPIGFRRNGDAVFELGGRKLVSWNPESKEFKYLRMIKSCTFIDSYIESLVLLDKAANDAVTY